MQEKPPKGRDVHGVVVPSS